MERILAPHDEFLRNQAIDGVLSAVKELGEIRTRLLALGDLIMAGESRGKAIRRSLAMLYRDIDQLKVKVGDYQPLSLEELEAEVRLRKEMKKMKL